MATYTTPKTWTNEPLVASDLNTNLRDNVEALKDPPSANYELNEGSDYTTTSVTFVDIDATAGKLSLTITTAGGDVMVHFDGTLYSTTGGIRAFLDVDIDSTRLGGDDGLVAENVGNQERSNVCFTRLVTGLAAGSHTFKLQWRRNANTLILLAGAGGTDIDVHAQFWVREMS